MDAHTPVLYREVLDLLQPRSGGRYVDGTLGAGGHAAGILEASAPSGRVLGLDRDPEAIAYVRQKLARFGQRLLCVKASFADMGRVAPAHGFKRVQGVLLDLGLSSRQLEDGRRGFSFMRDGPLDMRFDPTGGETAAELLNNRSEAELADIFWRYGEEKHSRRVARAIVEHRPLHSTTQLAEIIAAAMPRRGRIHPATKVFQSLRIAVNRELEALETGASAAISLLEPGGRIAIISFHSLEDRFVKQWFRRLSRDCVCPPQQPVCTCTAQASLRLVTRKAIQASMEEIDRNPRSRSARLRVAEKVSLG